MPLLVLLCAALLPELLGTGGLLDANLLAIG
jgi:hypothetical protein